MDDISRAKKIGYRQAFKAITAGLVVAYSLMALLSLDALWLFKFSYLLNIVAGIAAIYAAGFLFGGMAGVFILIKNRSHVLIGIGCGFVITWTATFLASLIGLFKEGLHVSDTPFTDYVFKPLWWITLFGFLPIVFVGFWFGNSVKAKSKDVE